ncbi:MAG: hypothetical protein JXR96_12350 [Deltaproteobacteria bacterium]|nr:hypothetical protein [Deltaproteobacteria bacterium]
MRWVWISIAGLVLSGLLLLGICLVTEEQAGEPPPGPEPDGAAVGIEPEPAPVGIAAPHAPPERPAESDMAPAGLDRALDPTEVMRVLEELAREKQALDAWDRQLLRACVGMFKQRQYAQAEECFILSLARKPDDADAYRRLGSTRAMQGKRVEAYWDYQKALEIDPDGPYAPALRQILDDYDTWASGTSPPEDRDREHRQRASSMARLLVENAQAMQKSDPQGALRKLRLASRLVSSDDPLAQEIERLISAIGD